MAGWICDKIPGPDNQWNGSNISRYCNPEYDALSAEFAEDRRGSNSVRRSPSE